MKINELAKKLSEHFQASNRECRFIIFFRDYLESYTKKDRRVIKQALDRYLQFIEITPDARRDRNPDPAIVRQFADHLACSCRGSGAYSTFARFKKVSAQAVYAGVLKKNPCNGIRMHDGGDVLCKDILSESEIRMLISTHTENENIHIRNAFLLCLYTGLRFCDIVRLRHTDIDRQNMMLSIRQSKTKRIVHIPLRHDLLQLIDISPEAGANDQMIFRLPSHPTCLKAIRIWVKEAGISKHITWHCARHTFATNILKNGADIRVVADLLGHSGLRYVERYTRAIDSRKIQAVNSLPPLG